MYRRAGAGSFRAARKKEGDVARARDLAERFGGAALVTGASSGIGEAFARTLARGGMDVVLLARRGPRLEEIASGIRADAGVGATCVVQDLTAPDAASRVLAALGQAGVHVGLLVNNAGFGSFGPFHDEDPDRALAMVDLNCRAPVALAHAFLPAMLARGRGGIVFTSSLASFQPTPFVATYAATKAFERVLAESMWAELRVRGVDVVAVCPGYTPTGFQAVAGTDRIRLRQSPTTPEQVVEAALGALGRRPSVIPGVLNRLLSVPGRLLPAGPLMRLAHRYLDATGRRT
jgi:short-subunit dehydrogenase